MLEITQQQPLAVKLNDGGEAKTTVTRKIRTWGSREYQRDRSDMCDSPEQ